MLVSYIFKVLFFLNFSFSLYAQQNITSLEDFMRTIKSEKNIAFVQVPGSMPGYRINGGVYATGGLDIVASSLFQYFSRDYKTLILTPKWKEAGIDERIDGSSLYTRLGSFKVNSQIEDWGSIIDVKSTV